MIECVFEGDFEKLQKVVVDILDAENVAAHEKMLPAVFGVRHSADGLSAAMVAARLVGGESRQRV